jgi:hypothetical protein
MSIDEIADRLFARIGCFYIAQWSGELARTLEHRLELGALLPQAQRSPRSPLSPFQVWRLMKFSMSSMNCLRAASSVM